MGKEQEEFVATFNLPQEVILWCPSLSISLPWQLMAPRKPSHQSEMCLSLFLFPEVGEP